MATGGLRGVQMILHELSKYFMCGMLVTLVVREGVGGVGPQRLECRHSHGADRVNQRLVVAGLAAAVDLVIDVIGDQLLEVRQLAQRNEHGRQHQTGGLGGAFVWPSLIRKLDRTDASYKT